MPFDIVLLARVKRNDPQLEEIHLKTVPSITDDDIIKLVTAAKGNDKLKRIMLYDANIGDRGAKALATLTNIELLNLNANEIGDEGAQALATMPKLKKLSIAGNNVTDIGAKALAQSQTIVSLILYSNEVTEDGIKAFLQNSVLRELVIDREDITPSVLSLLDQHIEHNKESSIQSCFSSSSSSSLSFFRQKSGIVESEATKLYDFAREKQAALSTLVPIIVSIPVHLRFAFQMDFQKMLSQLPIDDDQRLRKMVAATDVSSVAQLSQAQKI